MRVCPRLCSWVTACAGGRACWSVQLCESVCVRAPARGRAHARASLVARAPLYLCTCASAHVSICACASIAMCVCLCACACACARAHMRGRVHPPLRVLFVVRCRFSRGKPPPRCVESPPAARPRDAYRRLLTGVLQGPRTRVRARARVARAFRRAPMQCWAVLCAVFRRASDAPIGVEI